MTEQDQILIDTLKRNIEQLVKELKESKNEIDRLVDEKRGLEWQLNEFIAEHEDLKKRYDNLKVANAMVGNEDDNIVAKTKINKIVREIDKCMALLNK